MTGVALAIDASAGAPSYNARAFRDATAALQGWDGVPLAARQGLRPMGGSFANVVTLSGSTITVNIHTGLATPGWSTLTGSYMVALTVAETHTLTAAHATFPRKDIVVGRVYDDSEAASGQRKYASEYITGTAGASPSEPAVPQGAMRLATIDVPQSGGGSPVVTINHTFTAAAGGVLCVRNLDERFAIVSPYHGQTVWRMDRSWFEVYNGAWRVQGVAVCATPTDRDSAITNPYDGQLAFTTDTNTLWKRGNGAWAPAGPLGIIGGRVVTGLNTLTTITGGTPTNPTHMNTGSVTLVPNRRYRVHCRFKIQGTVNTDSWVFFLKVDAAIGTGGTQIRQFVELTRDSTLGFTYEFFGEYETGGAAETRIFNLVGNRAAGSGNCAVLGGDVGSTNLVGIWVEDAGPAGKLTVTAS